jgi:hypothetical protein
VSPQPSDSKKKKGKNFTIAEDQQLCRSWLNVSQDPVTGTGQKVTAFWKRVFEHYNEFKPPGSERSENSVINRWAVISQAVSKFCGCMAQIENRNKSGETLQNKVSMLWVSGEYR